MFKNYLRNIFNRELSADIKVQFIRFIINGIISAVGDISVLYILTDYFGIYYLISAAIGFIVGTTINYYISIIWVFEKGKIKKQLLEYALFVISSVIGLTINIFVMFVGVSIFYIHYLISKLFALSIVSGYNFLTKKYIIFSK